MSHRQVISGLHVTPEEFLAGVKRDRRGHLVSNGAPAQEVSPVTEDRVTEIVHKELQKYSINSRAQLASAKDEETGEYVDDHAVMLEVVDPTAPTGVRTFFIEIREVAV